MRPRAPPLDVSSLASSFKRLTTWQDPSASRTAFALGNVAFIAILMGKKAIVLLWIAWIAAFVLPVKEEVGLFLQDLKNDSRVAVAREHAQEAMVVVAKCFKSALLAMRERFSPPPK
jgi:type IV secretory pathway component VirB8